MRTRTEELLNETLATRHGLEYPDWVLDPPMKQDYEATAALFLDFVNKKKTEDTIGQGTVRLIRSLSEMHQNFDRNSPKLACQHGCNHCCTMRVTSSAAEVLVMANHLKRTLSPGDMAALKDRIAKYEAETARLTPMQQVLRVSMCPLNVDSLCIGYPARPMTCMGHHSLDVQDCIDDMNDPEGEPKIRKSSDRHGMMQFHHVVLTKSLRAIGCDATELEYIPALRIALEDNEAGTKYANGEANFSEADMADVRQAQTEDPYRKQP